MGKAEERSFSHRDRDRSADMFFFMGVPISRIRTAFSHKRGGVGGEKHDPTLEGWCFFPAEAAERLFADMPNFNSKIEKN